MEKLIITTESKKTLAKKLAKKLVKKGLAACVMVSKNEFSAYIYEGKFYKEREWVLSIKTAQKFKKVKHFIKKNHSYELPEIIGLKIAKIDKKYKKWLKGQR
ncbi:divalent cation tolerance protein CutA [Campylobacter sp. 19-13652]|uniref:divalent cation tolerance protein CutA n=1 Tax=Campylobacter sp. 19-13652 TaxID=2840180 RepID=UPI001C77C59A|nr:divalent cation tolerance protein CutA [Campylobacter sp. 19-13652]BCX79300.1 hypothetical protein LBC_07620 [Campylobacter sp. 19-13652]